MHAEVFQNVRKALVRRFPYGVFYQVEVGQVLVLAVFHAKRNPNIWHGRI